jgi:ribose 1,5-bisphosphokinase
MPCTLIYTVGPSGAGKDSLLAWLREHLGASSNLDFARRTIDRPATAQGEQHESLIAEFQAALAGGEFAMHWAANGHWYGIRPAELRGLNQGRWVVVNGSRAHLPEASRLYPGLTVLHITADRTVLLDRLVARQRESRAQISARLERSVPFSVPAGCVLMQVHNNTTLDDAGQQLLKCLGDRGNVEWQLPQHS